MEPMFTSDSHFCHWKINQFCNRGFSNIEEMNETLIENWNSVISPHQDVWHLGDFGYWKANPGMLERIFSRLHGNKRLIIGNHETKEVLNFKWAEKPVREEEIKLNGRLITMNHRPKVLWERMLNGGIHIYGHTHGTFPGYGWSMDVGVDVTGMHPVSLDQILSHIHARGDADDYDPENMRIKWATRNSVDTNTLKF
jgi:calcineurin-like phosphoesterase family protein